MEVYLILKIECKKIKLFLESIVRKYSIEGELKKHSRGKLILIWIMAIVLGGFASLGFPSILTIILFVIAIACMICGTRFFSKKDYRWFIYYAYNTCGGLLCLVAIPIGAGLERGRECLFMMIVIFCTSIVLSGIMTYIITTRVIAKGINAKISKIKASHMHIIAGAAMGVLLSRILPDEIADYVILCISGMAIGITGVVAGSIYYCGKRYDPECEIIKGIRSHENQDSVH